MALDFEALQETTHPKPAYNKEMREQREATLGRLDELGVDERVIANMCRVETRTVRRWLTEGGSPFVGYLGRRSLDRIGPVVQHMEDDLGLTDEAIATFLNEEPRHLSGPDSRNGNDAYFKNTIVTRIGLTSNYLPYSYPFFDTPKIEDGLVHVQNRLELRFSERQVEAQAGIVATPQTIV